MSAGGALSAFLGGKMSDTLRKRDQRWSAWLPAAGAILGFLPMIGVLYMKNFYAAIAFYFFEYLFAECWFGPALSIIQNRIPAFARGTTISIFLFISNMVGNIAPVVIGKLNDGTADSYRNCILGGVAISYGTCALLFFAVAANMNKPTIEEKQVNAPLLA